MTNSTKTLWGLRLEFYGLLAVLIATFWQASFTDKFDKMASEWQRYIQEEVNYAVLQSLDKIAFLIVEDEDDKREQMLNDIYKITSEARIKSIEERDRRKRFLSGQGKFFELVRTVLLMGGAAAFAIGKWLSLWVARDYRALELERRSRADKQSDGQ